MGMSVIRRDADDVMSYINIFVSVSCMNMYIKLIFGNPFSLNWIANKV